MNAIASLKNISRAELAIYGAAILLGLGIVVIGNVERPVTKSPVNHYMDKILSRMDTVGVQLAEWQAVDVRQ